MRPQPYISAYPHGSVFLKNCQHFCSRTFNQGLPEQFAFVTTFRNNRNTRNRWHLIRITDTQNQPQFAVGLDPARETIEFSILKYDRTLQTLTWEQPQVIRPRKLIVLSMCAPKSELLSRNRQFTHECKMKSLSLIGLHRRVAQDPLRRLPRQGRPLRQLSACG